MKSAGFALFAALGLVLSLGCSSSSALGPDAASDTRVGSDQTQKDQIGQLEVGPDQADLAADSTPDTLGDVAGDAFQDTTPWDAGNDEHDEVLPDLPEDVRPDVCQPSCLGKVCGEDGCGGSCGECPGPQDVCELGQCVCKPWCGDKECDGNGCGGSCGSCGEHFACEAGFCEYQPWCGDGVCDVGFQEECSSCPADCTCGCGEACTDGACVFTACNGKECGSDGCSGSCGTCPSGSSCVAGVCEVVCGDSECGEGETQCNCAEDCGDSCENLACGLSVCGWSCGACGINATCIEGVCAKDSWTDPATGLDWVISPPATGMMFTSAMAYCWEYAGGTAGWRLPTITELATLIRGCPATQPGGSCNVSNGDCTTGDCADSDCWGCAYDVGPAGGCYWPQGLGGTCGTYWSSNIYSDQFRWAVEFRGARLQGISGNSIRVRCVR